MKNPDAKPKPLKGLYIARMNLVEPHLLGVAAKIRAQISTLRTLPSQIDVVYPCDGAIVRGDKTVKRFGRGSIWRRLTYYAFFYFSVASWEQAFDFIYLRYQGSSPALLWMILRIRKRNPKVAILVEIPTFPYEAEAITFRAKFFLLIDKVWRRMVFSCVDRVITFSAAERIFGIPTIVTENGIEPDEFSLLPVREQTDLVRIVGVANVSFWHGYDRVVLGLSRYYLNGGKHNVHFDIVGAGAELPAIEKLVEREGLQQHVHFHGPRSGSELSAIMEQGDIGVSCIALHRKESDTSDLKSREYCARGLPFVIGYADRDFPAGLPFVYHAPADDSPLDIEGVLAFLQRLSADSLACRHSIRAYAFQHLTWRKKMSPVLDFLLDRSSSSGSDT